MLVKRAKKQLNRLNDMNESRTEEIEEIKNWFKIRGMEIRTERRGEFTIINEAYYNGKLVLGEYDFCNYPILKKLDSQGF